MREDSKPARALWGMSRTQIVNLIEGVTNGYSQTLEIHGVGFRAAMKGKDALQVQVGFSHDVVHKIPAGVEVKVCRGQAGNHHRIGDRQAEGRADGGRNPRCAPARALPGQGHSLSGRIHPSQGRQEEVGRAMLRK